jgi:hypothetical protein
MTTATKIETSAVAAVAPRAISPAPMPALVALANHHEVDPLELERVIRGSCGLADATREEFVAYTLLCRSYGLNPFLRELYALPKKGGKGLTLTISVDGALKIAHRHPQFAGIQFRFEPAVGQVESCTAIVYRHDWKVPGEVTEYFSECRRDTDNWRTQPRRMLRHRATIQAVRTLLGFSELEAEGPDDDDTAPAAAARPGFGPERRLQALDAIAKADPVQLDAHEARIDSYTASGTIDVETAADLLDAVNRRRAVLEQQLLRQMDAS